jgi:hypothetical protein
MFLPGVIIKGGIALLSAEMLFIIVTKSRFFGILTYIFFIFIGIIMSFLVKYIRQQPFLSIYIYIYFTFNSYKLKC